MKTTQTNSFRCNLLALMRADVLPVSVFWLGVSDICDRELTPLAFALIMLASEGSALWN